MTAAALAQTTTTWSGTVSSSWGDPGNWTNGVPIATRHANIPASTPFPPSTNGAAGATCLNLTVTSGATLNLAAGFPLDVNGIVNVTSSSTVTGPGLLRAVGTGHPGSISTLHAASTEGAIEQLALMALMANTELRRAELVDYARSTVDVFVQLDRVGGERLVSEIVFDPHNEERSTGGALVRLDRLRASR